MSEEAAPEASAAEVVRDVARLRRVADALGLVDLAGHVSARLPGSSAVAVSPAGRGAPPPLLTRAEDVVVVDLDGRVIDGRSAPPVDVQMDLAIYRASPDVGAVLFGSPADLTAFGVARRQLLPVTHHQSALALEGIPAYSDAVLIRTAERASALVRAMAGRPVAHIRGSGIVVAARSLLEGAQRLHALDEMARIYRLALSVSDAPRLVSRESAAAISAELAEALHLDRKIGHGALDAARYFWSFDTEHAGAPAEREDWPPPDGSIDDVRQRVATACRVLDGGATLVAYLEHVSHRIPGDRTRFAMSPAKRFAQMLPSDIGILSTSGDCEPLEGPYAPAPFRRYHRDLLASRPDVNAIVHTHELYGRALIAARGRPRAVHRIGAVRAAEPFRDTAGPNLSMSEKRRRENVATLGRAPILHISAHGTDFLGTSIEPAVVDAIQREQLSRIELLAAQLGEPAVLGDGDIAEIATFGPSYEDWWRYYLSRV